MRIFEEALNRRQKQLERLALLDDRFTSLRVTLFFGALLFALAQVFFLKTRLTEVLAFAAVVPFIATLVLHARFRRRMRRIQIARDLDLQTKAKHELDWEKIRAIPEVKDTTIRELPRYFSDLDFFHAHGLLRLVNQTFSSAGWDRLIATFNSNGVGIDEIRQRQTLAREVYQARVFRKRLLVTAESEKGNIESHELTSLVKASLADSKAKYYLWLLSSIHLTGFLLVLGANFYGLKPYYSLAIIAVLVTYNWARKHAKTLQAYQYAVLLDFSLGKLAATARVLESTSGTSLPRLREVLAPFRAEVSPTQQLKRVQFVTGCLGARQNYLVHLFLNLVGPWDYFWTLRLESVRARLEKVLPSWLESLATLEVAVSIAQFREANPDYQFADFHEEGPYLKAETLAHPTLKQGTRVANSLVIDDKTKSLIITGSNMSGKSTFLRSLGINVLLAKSGSVVCAKALSIRNLEVSTSLRVADSLDEGLSSFYAEVRELKKVLDRCRAGAPVLYLIDEIFRVTNNRERLVGSEAYLAAVAVTKACGIVATHDLELTRLATQIPGIANFHFKEDIEGDRMSFSYLLRPGPCPTTNALKVMELSGLPVTRPTAP